MFITLYDNNEVSPELTIFLTELKPEVDRYANAKAQAQQSRMLIIGRVNDYKNTFPQRSTDHRLLRQAMTSEWSNDVIEKSITAYNEYNKLLKTGVPEYMAIAENANPSQLVTLSRGEDTTLAYDAAKHFKQTGSLPSKGKMEQYLRGHIDRSFSSRPGADTQKSVSPEVKQEAPTPDVAPIKPQMSEDEQALLRMGVYQESARHHMLGLIANENLEYIKDARSAYLWSQFCGGSMKELLPIIQQKLSQSKAFEVTLREMLSHHNTIEVEATTVTPSPGVFDNQIHGGVRYRR